MPAPPAGGRTTTRTPGGAVGPHTTRPSAKKNKKKTRARAGRGGGGRRGIDDAGTAAGGRAGGPTAAGGGGAGQGLPAGSRAAVGGGAGEHVRQAPSATTDASASRARARRRAPARNRRHPPAAEGEEIQRGMLVAARWRTSWSWGHRERSNCILDAKARIRRQMRKQKVRMVSGTRLIPVSAVRVYNDTGRDPRLSLSELEQLPPRTRSSPEHSIIRMPARQNCADKSPTPLYISQLQVGLAVSVSVCIPAGTARPPDFFMKVKSILAPSHGARSTSSLAIGPDTFFLATRHRPR